MNNDKNVLKGVFNYFGYQLGYLAGILDRKDISDSEKVELAKKALQKVNEELNRKK